MSVTVSSCPHCARRIALRIGPARDITPRHSKPFAYELPLAKCTDDLIDTAHRVIGRTSNIFFADSPVVA